MYSMPKSVKEAWASHEGPIIFTTVDQVGLPNSIYATCAALSDDGCIVIADNYFNKTKANIEGGSSASVLFITPDRTSYQVKGSVEYHVSGPYYAFMKSWNPEKHPGRAAVVIRPSVCYSGSRELI